MNEQVEVRIDKLVYGGEGLARLESGKAVFVQGALPGERALVTIVGKRKGVYKAVPTQILEPSPDRSHPPCRGEKECTGATWQHISYPAQLKFKEEILLDTLRRTGGMGPETPLPIIASPETGHYRLRTQFNVRVKDGKQRIGFFRQGSYELIEVEDAFLLHPLINKALAALRVLVPLLPPLQEIHVNVTPSREAHLLFFADRDAFPPPEAFYAELRKAVPEVIGISGFAKKKRAFSLGRNYLSLEMEGFTYHVSEGNFYQVNWDQNRNMVRTVLNLAGLKGDETVLDLYCGIGNFSLPLARGAMQVVGVESGYSAVEDAKRNAERNGVRNVEFIADDLQQGLKTLLMRKTRADVIALDPPRAGATLKTLERILAFVPRKIVYVSCNPSTLARDLKYFRLFGFRLRRLQPIDMFPYTYHIECVAELVREGY
jgi:23S rRNA (uracil1939-C5)-methyltransferase